MPPVERARLRMEHELHAARQAGSKALKLVHGYGSIREFLGLGSLKEAIQKLDLMM